MTRTGLVDRLLGPRETVWGDGFAQEGWSDILSIRAWDDVDADLYARFCPGLPRGGDGSAIPGCLREHLRACVAGRALRFAARYGAAAVPPLRSLASDGAQGADAPRNGAGFSFRGGLLPEFRRWTTRKPDAADAAQERSWLLFLDETAWRIDQGSLERARPAGTALFAYLTAIHPAYLWPAAAVSHERDAAAAWLGIVGRGRPAFMTEDVASFFVDVITRQDRRFAIRDRQIALFAMTTLSPERLLKGAEARLRGDLRIMRRASMRLRGLPARAAPITAAWDEPDPLGSTPL